MEKIANNTVLQGQGLEPEPEEEKQKVDSVVEKLDMLNFYVSEIRAPNYSIIPKKRTKWTAPQPC